MALRLLLVLVGVLLAGPAMAASFDCGKARSPFARAVCGNPGLSQADDRMAAAFRAALDGLSEPAATELTSAHEAWAKFAGIACTRDARPATRPYDKDGIACLGTLFQSRTEALGSNGVVGGLRFYYLDRYAALPDPDPANDGAGVATKTVSTPRLDSSDAEARAFNDFIATGTGDDLDATIADAPQPDDGIEDDDNTLRVTYVDPVRISMTVNTYAYGHGAAHGNYTVSYVHYLRGARRRLEAGDVFAGDGWQDRLRTLALAAVKAQEGEELLLDDPASLDDIVVDPRRWDFSGDGLVLQFEPYEIAPYAAGAPTVTIPWTELDGLLAPEADRLRP